MLNIIIQITTYHFIYAYRLFFYLLLYSTYIYHSNRLLKSIYYTMYLYFYTRKCSLLKGGINNEEKIIIYH